MFGWFKKHTKEWQQHGPHWAYVRSDGRVLAEIEVLGFAFWVRSPRHRGFVTLIGAKDYVEQMHGK